MSSPPTPSPTPAGGGPLNTALNVAPGGGVGTPGTTASRTVTPAAWQFIQQATGANLNALYNTITSAKGHFIGPYSPGAYAADTAPDEATWLEQMLPAYMPQIISYVTNQAAALYTGHNLNPAQVHAVQAAVTSQLSSASADSFMQWFTDTSQSYATPAGLATKLTSLIGYMQPIGAALGPDLSAAIGLAGGTPPTTTPAEEEAHTEQLQAISAFYNNFGRQPDSAEMQALMGMSSEAQQNYMRGLQYKNGLTLGQWQDAETSIGNLYMQYFGRKPTDQEITWAAGKTADQIQEHILNSNSRVTGLTMGQYASYKTALDTVSQNTFGYEAPDSLIKAFHHASTAQTTSAPTPTTGSTQ